MTGRAARRVAALSTALLAAGTYTALGLNSAVGAPATVEAPADRADHQIATRPNSCGIHLGIGLQGYEPESRPLVLGQFDGNSADDVRIALPTNNTVEYDRALAHDCSTAIVHNPAVGSYLVVDLSTWSATRVDSGIVAARSVSATTDGRFITFEWLGGTDFRSIDVLTGEVGTDWKIPVVGSSTRLSSNGRRTVLATSQSGTIRVYVSELGSTVPDTPIIEFDADNADHVWATMAPSGDFITLRYYEGAATIIAIYTADGQSVVSFEALSGVLADDDHLLLCRADGSYRGDFDGRLTLIEQFDDYRYSPQEGGNPLWRSAKLETCRTHGF